MPDMIIHNALIYTMDPACPMAAALAVRGDRILAVGDHMSVRNLAAPGARSVDLHGRTIIPGLVDAHIHFEWYSLNRRRVQADVPTMKEVLALVANHAAQTAPGQWIGGFGWDHNVWGAGRFPCAADLDRVAPFNPVFLTARSGHAAWVNSAALRAAGITEDTADPEGGTILRDAHGKPTGILLENAVQLVGNCFPEPSVEESAAAIAEAIPQAWQAGITGIHDFDGFRAFSGYQLLQQRGELGIRVVKSLPCDRLKEAIDVGLRTGFGNEWLRVGHLKLFADGALGSRTAAMFEPYENESENRGVMLLDRDALYDIASKASAAGLAVAIHAIGDRANHEVLDVLAEVRREEAARSIPDAERRHRIEHVQLLHPSDYGRLAELKVIASMQPLHATSDMQMAERYWGGRCAGAYALRTQLRAGTVVAFGSDCPVEVFHPLRGIHAAVTRRRVDGTPGHEGWHPEQRIPVAEAIRGFTSGPAYAAGFEDDTGTLAAGKLADLVVLAEDIFEIDPMHISDVVVEATMVGGRFVWGGDRLNI